MTPSIDRWSMSHNSPFNYELVFEFIMKQQLKSSHPVFNPLVAVFCSGVCSSSWTFLHVNATRTSKVHAKSCTIYISYICSWCCTQPLLNFPTPSPRFPHAQFPFPLPGCQRGFYAAVTIHTQKDKQRRNRKPGIKSYNEAYPTL